MGHTRLGNIPKSQNWTTVIQMLTPLEGEAGDVSVDDNIEQIAAETLNATQESLQAAINDLGLRYTFYLLARVVLASRSDDWLVRLQSLGIHINKDDSLLEFTSEFQGAIDDYLLRHRYSSDISEIAQQAAGEALSELVTPRAFTLFGAGAEDLKLAIRDISTKNGFAKLGQKFFGTFISRYINFYVSRVTATQLGSSLIPDVGELTRFNDALQLHCEQSAKIVHDFSGEWYSKTEYKEGINLDNTARFIAVALKKLQAELGMQEADL